MNSYSKFMLAASIGLVSGSSLAANVESLFNNDKVLNGFNSTISKQATPTKLSKHLAQHFASNGGYLNLLSHHVQKQQQVLRYQQTYRGLDIWDHQLILMTDSKGELTQGYGALVKGIAKDLPIMPQIDKRQEAKQLEQFIEQHFSEQPRVFRNRSTDTVIYLDDHKVAHLAYKLNFFTDVEDGQSQPQNILAFVDVLTGELLSQQNILNHALKPGGGPSGNAKAERQPYEDVDAHITTVPLKTFGVNRIRRDKLCKFKELNVETRNYKHNTHLVNTPYEYTCDADNIQNDPLFADINTARSALNDAHFHGQVTSQMFEQYLKHTPFYESNVIQNVHYGQKMEQAFYDNGQVSYGDGEWIFYPMVALDVVAHEIAHGFTEGFGSGTLKYMNAGQAGAINESFSDIAGAAAEYFLYNGTNNWTDDWMSNQESYRPGDALRYFDEPTRDTVSIDHLRDNEASTPLHYAAGIFNKAFYRLVTATQVPAGEVNPWNTKHGFVLFAKANQICWHGQSTFVEAADCIVTQAGKAVDSMIEDGVTKADPEQTWAIDELKNHIRKAFAQVGINLNTGISLESDFDYTSRFLDYNFAALSRAFGTNIPTNDGQNWSWAWDFGDGNVSTEANPSHRYSAPGDYVVSLTTTDISTVGGATDTLSLDLSVVDNYCTAQGSNFDKYYIESVTIRGSQNVSGATGYTDFTATPVEVLDGQSFDVEIAAGLPATSANNNKYFYLWVDQNDDGIFDKASELVYSGLAKDKITTSLSVSGVSGKQLRLRAMVSFGILDEPCGIISFGEVEDYVVKIGDNNTPPQLLIAANVGVNHVQFENTTNDNRIASWNWNFGDDSPINHQVSPIHEYKKSGPYTVTLDALNARGDILETWTESLDILNVTTPDIKATVNGMNVTFDGSGSVMPAGSEVIWEFGDGETSAKAGPLVHTYTTPGTYEAKFTITNQDNQPFGKFAKTSVTVEKVAYVPAFEYTANKLDVTFNSLSTQPDDQSTTFPYGTMYWDYGDGSPVYINLTTDFGEGASHTYDKPGTYTASLYVTYFNKNSENVVSDPVEVTVVVEDDVAVEYCPAGGVVDYEYIKEVSFNDHGVMTNNNTNAVSVVNPGDPIVITVGQDNTYSITAEYTDGGVYDENYHIWIDFNGDGLFGDGDWQNNKTELVLTAYDSPGVNGILDLPLTGIPKGTTHTRMRIMQYFLYNATTSLDPCAVYDPSFEGGEIEDYEVTIINN